MNSILEWFIMSRMPQVYTTMGGVIGRNVPPGTKEGVSSTFGYSAALYAIRYHITYLMMDIYFIQMVKKTVHVSVGLI